MECYVCCERDGDDLRNGLCDCTDRRLHIRCQRKLLATTSQDGNCTVCKARFRNAMCVVERRLNRRWVCAQSVVGASYVGLLLCFIVFVAHARTAFDQRPIRDACVVYLRNLSWHHDITETCDIIRTLVLFGNVSQIVWIALCAAPCAIALILTRRYLRASALHCTIETRRWHLDDGDVGNLPLDCASAHVGSA